RLGLEHEPPHARLDRVRHQALLLQGREHHDLGSSARLDDLARGIDAVQERHHDVEHGDIRLMLARQLDRRPAVGRLGYDFEAVPLCKSRYLSGLQCHKQLWWRVHEPEAPELAPSPGQQNLFAQGREVGERARAHVPGGELIDLPYYQYDNKVAATREALKRGLPAIYEAWFLADETYVGVDILERASRGYTVIEVKASNSRKPEHLPDATVQVNVLRRAGLQVERAELMHLNSQC